MCKHRPLEQQTDPNLFTREKKARVERRCYTRKPRRKLCSGSISLRSVTRRFDRFEFTFLGSCVEQNQRVLIDELYTVITTLKSYTEEVVVVMERMHSALNRREPKRKIGENFPSAEIPIRA